MFGFGIMERVSFQVLAALYGCRPLSASQARQRSTVSTLSASRAGHAPRGRICHLLFVICRGRVALTATRSFHVLLVVFFCDLLVRDPDFAIHHFRVWLFLDQ